MYYGDALHSKSGINITRIHSLLDNGAIWLHKNTLSKSCHLVFHQDKKETFFYLYRGQENTMNFKERLYRASPVAQMIKNWPAMQETWVLSLGWEDPLEEGMATHSSILAWRIPMDREAWQATVHGVTESGTTEQLSTEQYVCVCVCVCVCVYMTYLKCFFKYPLLKIFFHCVLRNLIETENSTSLVFFSISEKKVK